MNNLSTAPMRDSQTTPAADGNYRIAPQTWECKHQGHTKVFCGPLDTVIRARTAWARDIDQLLQAR